MLNVAERGPQTSNASTLTSANVQCPAFDLAKVGKRRLGFGFLGDEIQNGGNMQTLLKGNYAKRVEGASEKRRSETQGLQQPESVKVADCCGLRASI
jgi:hypothetical protein